MHYLQKQLLEEEKKKAKLNAGHCKTEGKKKTKLNAGHCKTESEELDEGVVQVGFKDDSTGAAAVGSETSRTGLLAGGKKVKDGVYRLTFKNDRMKDKFMKKYASKIVDVVELKEEYEINERLDVGGILSSWDNVIGIINQVMETINSGLPRNSEFNAMASMVDYDGDGEVTFTDLTIALGLWGQGIMPATAQQYQAGQLMYDDSGLGDGIPNQGRRLDRPTPRPLPQRFPKPAIGQIPEGYELNEQKGQKFNFARARKVFEKHWREMERKVVNELVQPYEGRGPVNYDLKAERQVSDYFETNTEDLLDYITERFEDLN